MELSVEKGCFHYPGQKELILKDISFSVEGGGVLAVLGPNGVGKTTLMKCIIGLNHWTSGESFLDGSPISAMPPRQLFTKVAYVPQAKHLAFSFTAEELVLMGRSAYIGTFRRPSEQDRKIARQAMAFLSIEYLAGKNCSQISGGELQMVLIARALCQSPGVLILDEPESNLDFRNQLIILNTIQRLADNGILCIFNTHYPSHAFQIADKALLLNLERSALFGETREVVSQRNMESVFGVDVDIQTHKAKSHIYTTVTALSVSPSQNTRR